MGRRIRIVSRDTNLCARGAIEKTMCPPSSCPPGSRLSDVANIPTQAAIAVGCKQHAIKRQGCRSTHADPSTPANDARTERSTDSQVHNRLAEAGDASASTIPAKPRALPRATTNPAIGPAIPISNNAVRERIGERIRMTAPMVPIRVGAGMKNGSVAYTP